MSAYPRFQCTIGTCRVAPCASKPARIVCARAAETPKAAKQGLRKVSDLPVEEGWPLLGMTPEIVSNKFNMKHLFEKHGGPFVVNASLMGGYALFVEEGDDILEAQTVRQNEMEMVVLQSFLRVIHNGRKDIMPSTEANKPTKAALASVLSASSVMKLHVPLMIPIIKDQLQDSAKKGNTLWHEDMRQIAFKVSAQAVLGSLISNKLLQELYDLFKVMAAGAFDMNFGLYDGVPGTTYNKSVQAVNAIEDKLYPVVFEALKDEKSLLESDLILGRLMKSLQAEGAEIMFTGDAEKKADFFCSEVIGLMFGGTDTTAHALSQAAVLLSKHPEWLDRLWEEQQDLITTYGQEVTPQVVQKSALAAAVGQEILQKGNPNVIQQRRATCDTVVGDLAITAGQLVFLSPIKAIIESGEGDFNPAQWLKPGKSSTTSSKGTSQADCPAGVSPEPSAEQSGTSEASSICPFSGQEFNQRQAAGMKKLVFGAGPRTCSGQNLAVTEILTVMVMLSRYVKGITMAKEEQERQTAPVFPHPTGMPVKLMART